MSVQRNSEIKTIHGDEGTEIKQYFYPANTSHGINYSIAQFTLGPGKKSKLHKIKSSEIYYILEGNGNLKINNQTYNLKKDDSAYVPPNAIQCIENTDSMNLRFLCIVEPPWKTDNEIILE